MKRVCLLHWNAAEAAERAARLTRAGYAVESISAEGGQALRDIRANPPDAFVIDLTRLPSHGRAAAVFLRQQKATRTVPIVFVAGDPAKVARIRAALPDAVYCQWRGIRGALTRALKAAPTKPVVPDTMAGYSGTPLPKKLGIRERNVVMLLAAPVDFEHTLGTLPADVTFRRQARGEADVVMLFVKKRSDLDRKLPTVQRAIGQRGRVWVAWPKQTSGVATDLTGNIVRKTGLDAGLVDFKICAIDATWSGLCFVHRKR